jgi:IS30 family transposase
MRSYQQLSQEQRYTITEGTIRHSSKAEIARELSRSPSTISRELARNRRVSDGRYRADEANGQALSRRRKARCGFHHTEEQWKEVVEKLAQQWSPEQISNDFRQNGRFAISHETIYKRIRLNKAQGGDEYRELRIMPKARRKHRNSADSRGVLPGKRHISARPAAVESRKQLGHWEGDTVIGRDRHHCILTLVERASGLAIIKKLESRTAAEVNRAAAEAIKEYEGNFKTLTLDNGTEFHGYKELEDKFSVKCYFATPYHSWERGSNENLNGLIRQYLPKGVCMQEVTQTYCDAMGLRLNSRPRKRYGYRTPQAVFDAKSGNCTSRLNPGMNLVGEIVLRIEFFTEFDFQCL